MKVNIWNTRKTALEISNDSITGGAYFYYLLINQIIGVVILYYAVYSVPANLNEVIYEFVAVAVVTLFGLMACYNANGAESDCDLIVKFIVLSVPLTIKIAIIYIVFAYMQFSIFSYFQIYFTEKAADIITVTENATVQAIYFWRMSIWIKRSRSMRPNK